MIHPDSHCPSWAWLLPPLALTICVFSFSVDVLHWDEWVIWGEVLEKIQYGTFEIKDLVAQQNEQRNLAARVFGFLLMPFFKLNRFAEYTLNILLAGCSLLAAVKIFAKTTDYPTPPSVWLVFSLLVFSLLQWETFTFGSNSSVVVLPLGIWLGTLVAVSAPPSLFQLILLAVIGILPSFSFANGLFYWFCLLPVILFQSRKNGTVIPSLIVWFFLTCSAWLLYFWGYTSPDHHPSLLNGLSNPFNLLKYFFSYLGGAISSDRNLSPVAIAIGAFSLPLFLGLVVQEWTAGGKRREKLIPWFGIAMFSILSASVTAIARCGFGAEQALESRYATFSTPYWMAIFALFVMAWRRQETHNRLLVITKWFLGVCMVMFTLSTLLSTIVVYNRHDRFARARDALYSLNDKAALRTIFPDTAYLTAKLPIFLDKRLSIYRNIKEFNQYTLRAELGGSFSLTPQKNGENIGVSGVDIHGELELKKDTTAIGIILTSQNKIIGFMPLQPHSDSTWAMFVPTPFLPVGQSWVKAYAIVDNEETLVQLAPTTGIKVIAKQPQSIEYTYKKYFYTN